MLTISTHISAQVSIQHPYSPIETSKHTPKPNIQHGVTYKSVADISNYYVSEKLDGVRGYWDGEKLLTRQGNLIDSPSWFTAQWPNYPIDGELWIGRGKFQILQSCVSQKEAEEDQAISCWKNIRFMMFDLPSYGGDFTHRVKQMKTLLLQIPSLYLAMVNQVIFSNMTDVEAKLARIISMDGEGLMLHRATSYYQSGRNQALLKLKKHQDAEAVVIGYTQGKGKYTNQLGALEVETAEGITFKIGSGFSDYQRQTPPEIGSTITFKYNGLTDSGIPRFARYWRQRESD